MLGLSSCAGSQGDFRRVLTAMCENSPAADWPLGGDGSKACSFGEHQIGGLYRCKFPKNIWDLNGVDTYS